MHPNGSMGAMRRGLGHTLQRCAGPQRRREQWCALRSDFTAQVETSGAVSHQPCCVGFSNHRPQSRTSGDERGRRHSGQGRGGRAQATLALCRLARFSVTRRRMLFQDDQSRAQRPQSTKHRQGRGVGEGDSESGHSNGTAQSTPRVPFEQTADDSTEQTRLLQQEDRGGERSAQRTTKGSDGTLTVWLRIRLLPPAQRTALPATQSPMSQQRASFTLGDATPGSTPGPTSNARMSRVAMMAASYHAPKPTFAVSAPAAPPAPSPSAGPASSSAAGSGSGAASLSSVSTATASHSSTDPRVLRASWRVPSLLRLAADHLSRELLEVPVQQLDLLPPELTEMVCRSCSKSRMWSPEKLDHLAPQFPTVEEISISQCDAFKSEELKKLCAKLSRPLLRVDLSRLYNLTDLGGLVAAPGGLGSLRVLDLDRCRRISSAALAPVLAASPQLQELHLSGTHIDASTLTSVLSATSDGLRSPACPRLQKLNVSSCVLSEGLGALCLSNLPLTDLVISSTNFSLEQLMQIKHLGRSLRVLHVQFMQRIRDAAGESIAQCTQLEELDLSRNHNFSDAGVALLAPLTRLRILCLSHIDLTPASTPTLCGFVRLESLDVSYNSEVDDTMLIALCRALPRLRVLLLTYCALLTNRSVIDGIVPHLPRLQILKLNGCTKVGNEALEAIMERGMLEPQTLQPDEPIDSEVHAVMEDGASSSSVAAGTESPQASPVPLVPLRRAAANDDGDELHGAESSPSCLPLLSFPHSLLSFDFGSPAVTDSCVVPVLAQLIPRMPVLQRVAIWGSAISAMTLKRNVAEWVVREPSTKQNLKAATAAASASASSTDSSTCPATSPAPVPIPGSVWMLDESMKTAPGTYILVRRSAPPPCGPGKVPSQLLGNYRAPRIPLPLFWEYGCERGSAGGSGEEGEEGKSEAKDDAVSPPSGAHHHGRKCVSWSDLAAAAALAVHYDPLPEWEGEVSEEEEEAAESSVVRNDDDEDEDDSEDGEDSGSVVRMDSDGDGEESGSVQTSVIRNGDDEEEDSGSVIRNDD